MPEKIVRLGHAEITCVCGNVIRQDSVMKYIYPCILALQTSNQFIIRSSYNKLSLAESILGMLAPMKIKELSRKTLQVEGKEFIDIFVVKG